MNRELVTALKELLAHAEAGEITGLLFVTLDDGETVATGWTGSASSDVYKAIGGLSVLKRDFEDQNVQRLKSAA